jgi:chromosomal replication initiation ATPase DnaA
MSLQEINTLEYNVADLALNIIQIKKQVSSNSNPDELFKTIKTCKNRADKIVNMIYETFGYAEFEPLFQLICQVSGVTKKKMLQEKKNRDVKYLIPRQIHIALLHTTHKLSLAKTGELFYDKDHATVLHAIKSVNNFLDTDPDYREKYKSVFQAAYKKNNDTASKLHINYIIPKNEKTKYIRI